MRKKRETGNLLGVIAAIVFAIWASNHFSQTAAERAAQSADRPSATAATTTTTTVPGLVQAGTTCPTPGLGWRIDAYLTIQPKVPDVRVTAVVNGVPAFLGQTHRGHRTLPLERLEPNQPVLMTVEALDRAGQVSNTTP